MRGMRPQKQLLQFVMLALLSVVSVLVTSGESFAALDCTGCHGTTNDYRPVDATYRNITTGGFVGSHRKHIAAPTTNANDCSVCHNNSGYTSSHRNGQINMAAGPSYSKGVFFNQTSVPQLGTCSAASCHASTTTPAYNKATPTWGTAANCNSCHDTVPATGSHTKHLGSAYHLPVCADCHTGAVQGSNAGSSHLNNTIEVIGYSASPVAKHAVGTYAGSCSTTYCHSSGQSLNGASSTPVYAPITWGNSVTCTSCHVITTSTGTGSHVKHLAKDTNCGNCHTGASATAYNQTTHVDGNIDVAAGVSYNAAGAAGNGYGKCSAASCHAPFLDLAPKVTPTWGAGSSCNSCHDNTPQTGAHTKHLALPAINGTSCDYCHTVNGDPTHVDGNVNLLPAFMAAPVAKHNSTAYTATCTATCHNAYGTGTAITPTWGATTGCSTCHATPPATGAHTKHLVATGGACAICHTGASATTVDITTHANGNVDVTQGYPGVVAKHAAGSGYLTCSAASCHDAYGSTGIATPTWGAAATCNSCHNYDGATPIATGSHTKHIAGGAICANCHTNPGATGHINNTVQVDAGGYPTNFAKHAAGSNYKTCSTASCHDAYGSAGIATPTWGVADNCDSCHAATPATGSHTKHLSHTIVVCSSCHTNPGAAGHVNQNVSVNVGGYPVTVAKHTAGSGYSACSITCHNGGTGAGAFVAPAITWGASLNCASCHGYPPASDGNHGGVTGDCNSCHSNVKPTTILTTPSQDAFTNLQLHMNGIVEGGKCNACHGYPPVQSMAGLGINANYSTAKLENYSGGGGAHSVAGHLALTLKASQGLSFSACATCHPSGATHNEGSGTFVTANVQIVVDPQFKFDKNLPINYNRVSGSKSTGTCSNVACHFKSSPKWSTETYTQGH